MATSTVIVPALIALAFVVGAGAGIKWTTDIWFMFLDDVMDEEVADRLIERFKKWRM